METGRYGNRGEEEGELRARVPGIDVRNTPALLRERQETSHPPKTLPSKAIPPAPLGSGRTACCLEEERFARMQYKPRIYNFVRLSGCVPSKTLDTPPTHDRPLECTTSNPLPFAERGHLRDLPALAFSLHDPFDAFCWTVPTVPHSSSQNDIFNCASSGAMRTRLRLLSCMQLSLAATCASFQRTGLGGSSGSVYGLSSFKVRTAC